MMLFADNFHTSKKFLAEKFINQTQKFIYFSDRTTGRGQLLLFFEGGEGGGGNYSCSLRGGGA